MVRDQSKGATMAIPSSGLRLAITVALFCLGCADAWAEATTCEYAAQTFGVGSTICECPTLKAQGGLTAGGPDRADAQITSRRLICDKNGAWINAGSFCLELEYKGTTSSSYEDLQTYHRLYCPHF
jgi:hypothetical protein